MKKLILFAMALPCCTSLVNAQNVEFIKEYGVHTPIRAEQIRKTADGNLILLGSVRRANSLGQLIRDLQLIKVKPNGDTLWTRYVGLDERSEMGNDFEILENGNMLITGHSIYDMGAKTKGFLMCVDAAGTLLWDKYYGDDSTRWAFTSLKVTDDAVLLAGTIDNTSGTDALVVKTTLNGDSLWSTVVVGADYDDAWDIDLHPDGGYVFTGGTYSYAAGMEDDAWIVKLNQDGVLQWKKTYGTPDMIDWAWAFTPSRNASGAIDGYVFTGLKESGADAQASLYGRVHLVKVDTAGNLVWDKSVPLPAGTMRRECTDIVPTNDGGYAICGYGVHALGNTLLQGMYFLKIDSNGNIMYELFDEGNTNNVLSRALIQWDDNTYYLTGMTGGAVFESYKVFLAKINIQTTTVADHNLLSRSIAIFPNPADEHITVANSGSTAMEELNILSVDGRVLQTIPANGAKTLNIALTGYKNQTLFIKIKDDKENITHKKVTVL